MANHNAHINYTLADIEKYLQGSMSAAEMHQLEKAALQDPFLADAIEGFEQTNLPKASKNLSNIDADSLVAIQKTNPHYNIDDIEDYLHRNMDAAQMHQLEKTALQDPFLADAIEGYEQTNITSAKQHLHQISTAILGQEKEDAKVVAMPTTNNKSWLRIAASIILMIGAGSIIWLVNKSNTANPIASAPKNPQIQQDPSSPKITTPGTIENIEKENNTTIAAFPSEKKSTKNAVANDAEPLADVSNFKEQTRTEAAPVIKQESNALVDNTLNGKVAGVTVTDDYKNFRKDVVDSLKKAEDVAYARAKEKTQIDNIEAKKAATTKASTAVTPQMNTNNTANQLRGRVVNENGEGVPNAIVNLNNNNKRRYSNNAAISDANGYFDVQVADTSVNAEIAVLGYSQRNVNLTANRSNTIVLEKSNQTLADEVVVTGIGTKRKQTAAAILGSPIGGIKSFEDYVSKKKGALAKDSTADEEYVEGIVELEFDVDKTGKPYNISIVNQNAFNPELGSKAIQIVKEGPAWIADKKKKKAKVAIKF